MSKGNMMVLLVEDDPDDARSVFVSLEAEPVSVEHVRTGAEAMQALETTTPFIILVDHRLPDMTGVDLIGRIRASGFAGSVIMVSGVREDRIVAKAFEAGADDYMVKDLDFGDEVRDRLRTEVEA